MHLKLHHIPEDTFKIHDGLIVYKLIGKQSHRQVIQGPAQGVCPRRAILSQITS